MSEPTITVTEFLLARIAEDEAVAHKAEHFRQGQLWVVTGMDNAVGVNYNPARVLAECEAKRRIVGLHTASVRAVSEGLSAQTRRACQALAAVYADHEDYRQEWR